MTTTWCWPPIVRVLPRHGINAFVKKDNKVLTFLQTCEYLLWILVSLFAQRHTKTIPVEFQTSERRLACSHPRLEFQSSEKAKKKHNTQTLTSNHVILAITLSRYFCWETRELEHFDFSLSGFQQKSACDLHTLYPLFSLGSPSVRHHCLLLLFARSRELNHMQMPLQKLHFIPGQFPTPFLISMGLKNSQGGFYVLIHGLSPGKKCDSVELKSPLLKHIIWRVR